jgi:hypothetical protein
MGLASLRIIQFWLISYRCKLTDRLDRTDAIAAHYLLRLEIELRPDEHAVGVVAQNRSLGSHHRFREIVPDNLHALNIVLLQLEFHLNGCTF